MQFGKHFILTMCPVHFIRLLTILPTMQPFVSTSSPFSSSYPVVLACTSILRCCCSDIATVTKQYVLVDTTQAPRAFSFSLLELFLPIITPTTFLHGFLPSSLCYFQGPPKYTKYVVKKGNKINYPRAGDTVLCYYVGKLTDGTVFDTNSEMRVGMC